MSYSQYPQSPVARGRRPVNNAMFYVFAVLIVLYLIAIAVYFAAAVNIGHIADQQQAGQVVDDTSALSDFGFASFFYLFCSLATIIVFRIWRRQIILRHAGTPAAAEIQKLPAVRAFWIGWIVVILASVLTTHQTDAVQASHNIEIYMALRAAYAGILIWCAISLRNASARLDATPPVMSYPAGPAPAYPGYVPNQPVQPGYPGYPPAGYTYPSQPDSTTPPTWPGAQPSAGGPPTS